MRIGVDISTNLILGFEYLNNPTGNFANSIRDVYAYLLAQGVPFKKDQVITGRAGDLGFDVSSGSLMEFGGTGDINNANILSLDAVANASYTLTSRTTFVSTETNLVKFWDNAGTITALGSGTVVGHRLYRFSNGNFAMQYGQGNYANMTLAKSGALVEEYVLNPSLKNATFFGWWFINETATNTGGTTLTDFKEYTIGIQGGSSSGLAGCLLIGNNLSDLLDASAARINLDLEIGVDVQAYNATYLVDADIGSTVQAYDVDTAKLDVVQNWTASQAGEITALTDGTNITTDLALSNFFSVTLAGNRTLDNPTNIVAGQSGSVFITQDATGSRSLAYGSYWDFAGGIAPTLSTAANTVDRLDYLVRTATSIHTVLTKAWA